MKSRGSSLVEYTMGGALVAVVIGFAVLALNDSDTISKLFASSLNANFDGDKGVIKTSAYVNDAISAQVDDPNNDIKPVSETCSGENCTINFGEYSLTGVPDNFSNLVETSGIAGGTDKMADILQQLAEQSENIESPEVSQKMKTLSNYIFNISMLEEQLETTVASKCNNTYITICHVDLDMLTMPTNFNSEFGDLGTFPMMKDFLSVLSNDVWSINQNSFLDVGLRKKVNQLISELEAENLKNPALLDVAKVLSYQVVDMGEQFAYVLDPMTQIQELTPLSNTTNPSPQEYVASKVADVDAEVICNAGNSEAVRQNCQ